MNNLTLTLALSLSLVACAPEQKDSTSPSAVLATKALEGTDSMTHEERVDHVRDFVNLNSIHLGAASPYDTSAVDQMSADILKFMDGSADAPSIKCGHRAKLQMAILSQAGVQSRIVNLLTEFQGRLEGHVFLEILNPETQGWEVSDPDFNIYYSDGQKRLSLVDLITLETNAFAPCRNNVCGWNIADTHDGIAINELIRMDIFQVGLVHPGSNNIPVDNQQAIIISNRARLDVTTPRIELGGDSILYHYSTVNNGTQLEVF